MKKVRYKQRILSAILVMTVFISTLSLGTLVNAGTDGSGAVSSDSATFDVLMNVDPSYGVDASDLAAKVGKYLDKEIEKGGGNKNYRLNTTAAKIDPTDLTKWNVYDHYDTDWYTNEAAWRANYNGRGNNAIPETWYYYGMHESQGGNTGKLTIKDLIDKARGTTWGSTAILREHIYTFTQNDKPAMQFYGYGTSFFSDFLYYPATNTSTKTVKFDVNATDVKPHSLKYAGYLINCGVNGIAGSSNATMDGYLMVFEYGANSSGVANSVSGVYLYKLDGVNVNDLHAKGVMQGSTKALLPGVTQVSKSSFATLYPTSHIELDITSTTLKATIAEVQSGGTYGAAQNLFNIGLTDTGFGGFGPYVDYGVSGHTCNITSSFLYSNLEMSFKEPMAGNSPLEAYQYADYLKNSENRFFINLTKNTETNYVNHPSENDLDKGYIKQIQDKKAIVITDEGTQAKNTIFPEYYLADNTKNVYDSLDVSDADITHLNPGSDKTEVLAAKLAWLIYNTQWKNNVGNNADPESVIVGDVKLMDKEITTAGDQVNNIFREYIETSLKVYPNPKESTNVDPLTDTPHYTLTYPNKTKKDIILEPDGSFSIGNDWSIGEYTLTITYTSTDPAKTQFIPANTTFTINTDSVAPSMTAEIDKATADFTFNNAASSGNYTYTSPLASYGYVVTDTNTRPGDPTYTTFADPENPDVTDANLGDNLKTGKHYLHTFVKDAAGNVGYASKDFTITAPTVKFVEDTSKPPYKGDNIEVAPTAGSYDVGKVEVSIDNGANWSEVTKDANNKYFYTLPPGQYTLQAKTTDTANNNSTVISTTVDAKKNQLLKGIKEYNLEVGIDLSQTFDLVAHDEKTDSLTGLGITYAAKSNPNGMITVAGNSTTINKTGTAIVEATAAFDSIYREITDTIKINVKNPLSVQLNAKENDDKTGIVVHPTYEEGFHSIDHSKSVLKYRAKNQITRAISEWTVINGWNWDTDYTISYSDLDDFVTYEIVVESADLRAGSPHAAASAAFPFTTPDELPQITISNLGNGIRGEEYTDTVAATGTDPMTWDVTAGALPDGLTLDPNTGAITGTPTTPGDFTFTITVTNAAGNTTQQEFTVTIADPPTITTLILPDTIRGDNYDQMIVTKGDATITWALTSGALPNGITLDTATGQLKGIATEFGTFNFGITATNDSGTDTKQYTLFVADPPTVTTDSVNNGIHGIGYTEQLVATGDATITWAVTDGALPDGLALDSNTGIITGTPTKPGSFIFEVTATNTAGSNAKKYTVVITDPPIITTDSIANATKGTEYNEQLEATGNQPITWSVADGVLPAGITLDTQSGALTGTPTQAGNFTFRIAAENDAGFDSKEYTTFVADPPAVEVDPTSPDGTVTLPNGTSDKDYEGSIDVTGDKPMEFIVKDGALPDGLELDKDTGRITGTPTKPGDYTFTVEIKNEAGTIEQTYKLHINAPLEIIEQPKDQNVYEGDHADFCIGVTGEEPITYQWQINRGNGWENIDGATSKDYTFPATLADNGVLLRCVMTNGDGTVTISDEVTLTVLERPADEDNTMDVPPTGDGTNLGMWIGIMLAAIAGIVFTIFLSKRKQNNN